MAERERERERDQLEGSVVKQSAGYMTLSNNNKKNSPELTAKYLPSLSTLVLSSGGDVDGGRGSFSTG